MLSAQQLSSGTITRPVSLDEHIRQALDRATAAVRAHLDAELAAFTDELTRAAAEERSRAAHHAAEAAAAEVYRQAEIQIAHLREAAERQAEEIRRAAEAQVGQIKTALQAQLEEVRRTAQAQVDDARRQAHVEIEDTRRHASAAVEEARRTTAAQVEEARRHAQREIDDARRIAAAQVDDVHRRSEEQLEEMRRDYEAQVEEARKRGRAELESLGAEMEVARRAAEAEAEEVVISQLATAQAQAERRVNDAAERTRTDAHQAELAHAARLVDAIRTLDDARALGEVLDALADCAGREVDRAAVLLVKGERLRGWRLAGFPDAGPAKNIELDLDGAGLAGAVVRTGVTVSRPTVAPGDEQGTRQPALPPFAQSGGARHAMALPIVVGGQVVAVLYGDAPRLDTPSSSSRWPAVLEILARHGSRALEAMTVQQAAGFSLPRPVARASHTALPGPVEHGGNGDEDAARRYARLLLSEIRIYHEPLVDAGRRSRDLRTRLRGEIDRARRLYEARVPPAIREQSDFFEQELVRTLADGDRSLLG
jgi:F0F1-type ATP synthase membrane subunit b/b'